MMSEWFCCSGGGQIDIYRRMNTGALFAFARDVFPPLAEITVLPLAEGAALTDAALDLEYRSGVLDLYSAKKESTVSKCALMRDAVKRPFARLDGDYSRPFGAPTPNPFLSRIRSVHGRRQRRTRPLQSRALSLAPWKDIALSTARIR